MKKEKIDWGKNLLKATKRGDLDTVKECIKKRVKVNILDREGNTPLHYACSCKNIEMVDLLIKAGANVNKKNRQGFTPISLALFIKDDIQVAKKLVDSYRVDLNKQDFGGRPLLTWACEFGNMEVVDFLINFKVDVNKIDEGGYAPIHVAIMHQNMPIIEKILDNKKVNINKKDKSGRTPLHFACRSGNEQIVKSILGLKPRINEKDIYGDIALQEAYKFKNIEVVKIFFNEYLKQSIDKTAIKDIQRIASNNENIEMSVSLVNNAIEEKNTKLIKILLDDNRIVARFMKNVIKEKEKSKLKGCIDYLRNEGRRLDSIKMEDGTGVLGEAIKSEDIELANVVMKNYSNETHEKIMKLKEIVEDKSADIILENINRKDVKKAISNRKLERIQENVLDLLYTGRNQISRNI